MMKFISKVIASKVISFQERAILGSVTRVLIDPADGALLALVVNVRSRDEKYIPQTEVKGFGEGVVIVEGVSSLSDAEEVIKIAEALEEEPIILGAEVVTEAGDYLGRVDDATLDLGTGSLKSLYVNPKYLGKLLGEQKIISLKQVLRIEKRRIIVKDLKAPQIEPSQLQTEILAAD
jgi:uncharacterized protein YrrD